jgi:hypothetical protein
MATFSSGVKCFRSFLIRSLRYLNGRTLSPFPTEAGHDEDRNNASIVGLMLGWGKNLAALSPFLTHSICPRFIGGQSLLFFYGCTTRPF